MYKHISNSFLSRIQEVVYELHACKRLSQYSISSQTLHSISAVIPQTTSVFRRFNSSIWRTFFAYIRSSKNTLITKNLIYYVGWYMTQEAKELVQHYLSINCKGIIFWQLKKLYSNVVVHNLSGNKHVTEKEVI